MNEEALVHSYDEQDCNSKQEKHSKMYNFINFALISSFMDIIKDITKIELVWMVRYLRM